MVDIENSFKLLDGTYIPVIAWGNGSGGAAKNPLESGEWALKSFTHIDTASGYNNEEVTGETIRNAGLEGKVYVTSKLSQTNGNPTNPSIPLDQVRARVLQTIAAIGFQPDLLLIHNPFVPEAGKLVEFWKILESMKDSGELTSSIGVSNFRKQDLEELLPVCKYKPVVNQIEYHPFILNHMEPILSIMKEHNIVIEAYGPLSPILRHPNKSNRLVPVLTRIANRLSNTTGKEIDNATILLLWTRAMGVVAVTSSNNEERIKKLSDSLELGGMLTEEEVIEITTVGKQVHFSHYREHMSVDVSPPTGFASE